MKVLSTNLGNPTSIIWNSKEIKTGIYKYPTSNPLFLGKIDVKKDTVIDRKHHGGIHKACYLFSANQYPYWKNLYPNLDWNWGMFGENLTIDNMDDSKIRIGSIYKIGTALVQVTQPREPCYKFGIRFENQKIIKEFIDKGFPGTYVKVLEEGIVTTGDQLILVKKSKSTLTVSEFYSLIFSKQKDLSLVKLVLENDALPEKKRNKFLKYLP